MKTHVIFMIYLFYLLLYESKSQLICFKLIEYTYKMDLGFIDCIF